MNGSKMTHELSNADPAVRELFLAWRAPDPIARWYTVGRLLLVEEGYAFEYTAGFRQARDEAGMRPIQGFPDLMHRYVDQDLFPLFSNRLMRPSRPDYARFIAQLGFDEPPDPLDLLARSEGYRATDHYRVYPRPRPVATADGSRFRVVCFVAGLRFQTEHAQARAARLVGGDGLQVVRERGNVKDPHAHCLVTDDGHHIGYVPRYHAPDLTRLTAGGAAIDAVVLQNNTEHTPTHRQVLFRLDAAWPHGFTPLATEEHRRLSEVEDEHEFESGQAVVGL